jgi:hypothetical protein
MVVRMSRLLEGKGPRTPSLPQAQWVDVFLSVPPGRETAPVLSWDRPARVTQTLASSQALSWNQRTEAISVSAVSLGSAGQKGYSGTSPSSHQPSSCFPKSAGRTGNTGWPGDGDIAQL